ncbi:MAG: 2-oxoacid:acceptor oxidoreductase family protein [Deltaproteobacteria bacterium]|nr:2-oxoacid:acceptor oxidoreductase family protein [Deltaproteobacteria bacterium]
MANQFSWQAVVAGVGGQGVLFLTRLLALAAQEKAGRILISEVHGMAQRGGSVVSHLKAGEFASPLVTMGQADLVLSLEPGEAVRNVPYLAPGAVLVVNAPGPAFLSVEGRENLAARDIRLVCVDAAGTARREGFPRAGNVVLAAAAAQAGALPFSPAEMAAQLAALTPPARQDANTRLFEAGLALTRAA